MINRLILKNVDDKTLANFKETNRDINKILGKEIFYWIRTIKKYNENFKEFQDSWKKATSKSPACIVYELALEIGKFHKQNQAQ